MKKIILIFLILFSNNLYSQSWELNYPYPTYNKINDVSVLDNGDLVMACNQSEIYKSTNNGTNWIRLYKDDNYNIHSISCVSNLTWYIFTSYGSNYQFIKTTDGGNTFSFLNNIQGSVPTFLNEQTGYVFSYSNGVKSISKTTNGGNSWNSLSNFELDFNSYGLDFKDEMTGYICGHKVEINGLKVLKTTDGGFSWNEIYSPPISPYNYLTKVQVFNDTVYVFATGIILKSINNGQTWEHIKIDSIYQALGHSNMSFQNSQYGAVTSYQNEYYVCYTTSNGGISWKRDELINDYGAFSEKAVVYKNNKIFIGYNDGFYSISTNNGVEWTTNKKFDGIIAKFNFIDENTGYILTRHRMFYLYYSIYKTTDRGNTWFIPDNFLNGKSIADIVQYSPGSLTILKSDSIYNTTNDGSTWSGYKLPTINDCISFRYMEFINGVTVLKGRVGCVYSNAINFISNDSAKSFTKISLPSGIRSFQFINHSTGYAVNNTGRFYKTINGGTNWILQGIPNVNSVSKFFIFNDGETWGTTFLGLSRTQDFENWSTINNFNVGRYTFLIKDLSSIFFINSLTDNTASISKTTDRGLTWYSESFPFVKYNQIFPEGITFANGQTGYIFQDHRIFKTTNGGIITSNNPISNSIPTEFSLHQNYPNPFNPVTNIKFSLPTTQYTILKVFDITGREIATLVNEQLSAGEYSYQFNADDYGLSSGVYFYQLSAGDHSSNSGQSFVQTRKLILIK